MKTEGKISPSMTCAEVMEKSRIEKEQSAEVIRKSHELIYQSKSLRYRARLQTTREDFSVPLLKTCSCGRKVTPAGWSKLQFVGYTTVEHLDAELRNCPCGSTLTLIIERRRKHE